MQVKVTGVETRRQQSHGRIITTACGDEERETAAMASSTIILLAILPLCHAGHVLFPANFLLCASLQGRLTP